MGTCNFSKVNARRYYVVDDRMYYNADEECWQDEEIEGAEVSQRDWQEIVDDLQEAAKFREDGKRFRAVDEPEAWGRYHRDEGRVVLDYDAGFVLLSRNYCLSLYGKIIVRPGYYEGATLDWDFEVNGSGSHWNMNEYDDINDIADEIVEDWDYCERGTDWNAGIKAMQRKNIRRKIDEALGGLVEKLEQICADLVGDNIYQCAAVFSNGEAIYDKVAIA